MKWTSLLAIFFLCWVFAAFITLPFGVKTSDEVGEAKVAGQADSAPHKFDLPRHLIRATIIGAALTAVYALNYSYGWIGIDDLDLFNPPASEDNLVRQ